MEFKDTSYGVFLHQHNYAQDILKIFKKRNCNAAVRPLETGAKLNRETNDEFVNATLYKQIIRSLRYLCSTRTGIFQSVEFFSKFMDKPQECNLTAVKRVLRYIKETMDHGVLMPRYKINNKDAKVYCYTNSNFGED